MGKKDDLSGAPAAIGMVVLALLFLGLTFAIYPGWEAIGNFLTINLLLTAEAPAWVQAVGSVLAIFVAIYIPWRERKASKKDSDYNDQRVAIITSWELLPVVESMERFIGSFSQSIEKSAGVKGKYQMLKHFHSLIGTVVIPADVQIIRVSKMPNDVALILAQLSATIKNIQHYLSFTVGLNALGSDESKEYIINMVTVDLINIERSSNKVKKLLIDYLESKNQKVKENKSIRIEASVGLSSAKP